MLSPSASLPHSVLQPQRLLLSTPPLHHPPTPAYSRLPPASATFSLLRPGPPSLSPSSFRLSSSIFTLSHASRQQHATRRTRPRGWKVMEDRGEQEKEAQASLGEPIDDDDDDEDEEDEDLDDDDAYGAYSPSKKRGKALKPSDGKLAMQLALQKESEKETLQKTKELLEKLKDKTPKQDDNPFDAAAAREEIEDRQRRMKRPAGDPIYIPIMRDDKGKTGDSDAALSKAERRRRDKIRSMQLLLRVAVNGKLLRKVDGRLLEVELMPRAGSDFSFRAKETIHLAPTSGLPEIEIHVCQGGLIHSEIASLFVPVGEEGLTERGDPLVFQSRKPFELDPAVVGMTKQLAHADSDEKFVLPTGEHYTTGQMFLRLNHTATGPSVRTDGSVAIMVDAEGPGGVGGSGTEGRNENRGGMVSSAKLKKMIQTNQLDPNDPRNRHLLDLLSTNKEQESDVYVRFDPLIDTLLMGDTIQLSTKEPTVLSNRWIGAQDITRPAGMRHKMLMARDRNPGAFAGEWPDNAIPLLDREIDQDEVRQDDFFQKVYAVEFEGQDEESGQRAVDNKQMKKLLQFKQKVQEVVRKHKAKQGQRMRRVYRLEDVVHQPELPTFGAPDIVAAIKYFFRKRSALRPEEKPVKVTSANPAECRISVTVQRAQNLPQRRPEIPAPGQPGHVSAAAGGGAGGRGEQAEIGAPLECIVQARFGKSMETTPVFKGNNPAWNAHLNLKFEPPNKSWSPSNLMKVTDYLHLNIFDTKVWKKPDMDGQMTKLEKRWLGSIRFPFTTLYTASARGRIEGVFEIDAPPHIIGYTTAHNQHAQGTQTKGSKKDPPAAKSGPTVPGTSHLKSTLQVCVALDPPLAQPSQRERELKGRLHGQPELDARVREWIAECSRPSHCRDRSYDAVGRTLNRDYVLATRFVTKEAPPELDESEAASDERKMAQLCRYVSLIPFLEDFHLEDAGGDEIDHEGLDVWCTSAEFLHFMAGDWEEHATLLCNFFLHMNKTAYVVFGSGIPEGDTVYVMTVEKKSSEEDQVWFWNASKGCKYHSKDDKCTLKEIYYVVGPDNVWGNVQVTKDLTESSFNLKDIKCWRPLFDEKHPASKFQTETVQEKIDWKLNQKNDAFVFDVQNDISLIIRNRLEHWRSREGKSLVENEAANRTLVDILKTMEKSAHNGTVFTEEDHHQKLAKFLQPGAVSGMNMTGFYINRPYTDPQQIIDEIENADIHHAGPVVVESDMQFAHAVYVRAFPRRVLSLWVAVACLSRKR